jgi:hypothetical protein
MNRTQRTAFMVACLSTLQAHLAAYPDLAAPCNASIDLDHPRADVTIQLSGGRQLDTVTGGLRSWAESLTDVTAETWRPSADAAVHLSVSGRAGGVSVRVFDAVIFDELVFPGLEPDQRRPIQVEQLCTWSTGRR